MQQPPQPPGGERPQRRMPPPDATGQEAEYLGLLRERRTPVVVEMIDGQVFRGVVEYYDRDVIKVNRPEGTGPNVFVRKKHVRSLREE
jgi:sRNA-binding regulator protein Hfq